MLKKLTQLGNSKALVIDKSILIAAGLDEEAFFSININPNGGIIIQSVQDIDTVVHKKNVKKVIKKRSKLLKRLADK